MFFFGVTFLKDQFYPEMHVGHQNNDEFNFDVKHYNIFKQILLTATCHRIF